MWGTVNPGIGEETIGPAAIPLDAGMPGRDPA